MSIVSASRSTVIRPYGEKVLFEWNEVDLSQFEEAYRDPSADGVLSVDTNVVEPYQPILKFESSASSQHDFVFYRLLDGRGDPLIIPPRARFSCVMGPQNALPGVNYGNNMRPEICLWYVDEAHRIGLFDPFASGNSNSLGVFVVNGTFGNAYAWDPEFNLKTDFRDAGDVCFLELNMRKPSTSVDPGGIAKFGGFFSNDVHQRLMSDAGWNTSGGTTPPSTSWSPGWDGPVHAAIGFKMMNAGAGSTYLSKLVITEKVGF